MPATPISLVGYHLNRDAYFVLRNPGMLTFKQQSEFTYTFENFFHPFVGQLISQLNRKSLPGVLDPAFQAGLAHEFFTALYTPQNTATTKVRSFPKEIDVREGGPYAVYNWELFFHLPLTVAVHLSKNQRFAEAQRWFHHIFDPTANDTSVPSPQRFWKFLAFRDGGAGGQIDEALAVLSKPAAECTPDELELKGKILAGYEAIRNRPFQPHAVARTRHLSYMYYVVMKYLDNLVAWGDHLYRQDTIESINEATQLYVLAANILGARPEAVPTRGRTRPRTFAQLKAQGLDPTGNVLVALEGAFPFNLGIPSGTATADASAPLFGLGRTLYFCVPRNDRMLGYWDTVADRLSKIRHGLNLAGAARPLALFDPPIDPGMLVKAAAAGIDIGAVVAGLHQPVSPVRAQVLIQKALELCAEVRGLGNTLLSAIEKGDGERLALLRQSHETKIQQLQREARFLQWKQAQEATEALIRTRAAVLERYRYYLRLLGAAPDAAATPEAIGLDRRPLTEETFDEAYAALVGRYDRPVPAPQYPRLSMQDGDSPARQAGAQGPGRLALTTDESDELGHLGSARDLGLAASIVDATGSAMVFIPDINADLHYWGLGGTVKINVGTAILKVLEITAKGLQAGAAWERDQAGIASRTAAHARRADDWTLQVNLAARELQSIGRQIITSLIAEQLAGREYRTAQQQITHAEETDRFLRDKFTSAELYTWMQGELSRLYYEHYRFAFDLARRAEQTLKRELMRPELDAKTLVAFNYWDGGRKGLLSGEALYLDVKRMELAYHEHNLREYELTTHVSLLQLDPMALIALRATGRCVVRLPESLFDMDGPGHYFRRIRSVAVSVPCVTGPYSGVHCRLTLLTSSVRVSTGTAEGYPRTGLEDGRFQDWFAGAQSIVASGGVQDDGLFESGARDERYLPFENAGAISEWRLELPGDPSRGEPTRFDYATISDVVLHLRYTARDGGATLRAPAVQQIRDLIGTAQVHGAMRLFSVRQEFPGEWARFLTGTPAAGHRRELTFTPGPEHYPYWSNGHLGAVARVDLIARTAAGEPVPATLTVADRAENAGAVTDVLGRTAALDDLLVGRLATVPLPATPTATIRLHLDDIALDDLWVAVTWAG
ncbi:hypothetical protein J2S43_002363 [Catenuloplanes nepalensis]|uniref:Tc toxin complex TcA C-terminal TcB-binding domain-containing protein n=1 Tax=Catenuloplanes nepalensis TaxID=587533 RepID=A0ABT9MS57_9ACTN|nr:hypothetical protein [Catenuloplanes nepalensis]MDP9793851.1 hypothetical protein [Catenuloplanes nepalensis]